ncbi:MAG: methyltransferase, TIGR04325 family [Lentisphaeria bacterium]|nr:methyltransferase, TIGR04325 family [Lentisphaeria bacterium]
MGVLKKVLRSVAPHGIVTSYEKLRSRNAVEFAGTYASWSEAAARSEGYDAAHILEKVISATREVLAGNAVFERDSILFREESPNYPLIAHLLAAAWGKRELDVLDFGGALGSVFFQNRRALSRFDRIAWRIVEQPHFVAAGRELFKDHGSVFFYGSVEQALAEGTPDVILFSSVLQYLPDYEVLLKKIKAAGCPHVFMDRTLLFEDENTAHRFCVQHVSPEIYEASYPVQIFPEKELTAIMAPEYGLADKFLSYPDVCVLKDPRAVCRYYGLIFESKGARKA